MKLSAYAKLNIFLDVSARRADGYHDIVSYMQTVSLADELTVEKCSSGIRLDTNYGDYGKKDLAYRAAEAFFEYSGIDGGVSIKIEKRIPVQGGLAGGSTDAAAVLRALNVLYETEYSQKELAQVGARIGSDVPFCVVGGSCIACGRGEILKPAPSLPDCGIVIAKAETGVSTPEQFAELDSIYGNFEGYKPNEKGLEALLRAIENKDIKGIGNNLYNIFEKTEKGRLEVCDEMRKLGACGALLSGSGGSAFGIFTDFEKAQKAAQMLNTRGFSAIACHPVEAIK